MKKSLYWDFGTCGDVKLSAFDNQWDFEGEGLKQICEAMEPFKDEYHNVFMFTDDFDEDRYSPIIERQLKSRGMSYTIYKKVTSWS